VLINDILDFSKIDAGKLELEVVDFDLIAFFEETVESFSYPAYEKDLELILDIAAVELRYLSGDSTRLRQILTNLISNAIKFTARGEIVVCARTKSSNEGATLEIRVSDSGVGIPPEKMGSLFDMFTQADESTTRKFGGTGLGLSIVKNLCELMSGEIKVESKWYQGSTFTAITKFALSEKPSSLEVANLMSTGILIVHQNRHVRLALGKLLKAWGAQIHQAGSVKDALRKITGNTIDTVFFDSDLNDWESLQNGSFVPCELTRSGRQPKTDNYISTPILRTDLSAYFSGTKKSPAISSEIEVYAESKRHARLLLVEDNNINIAVALGILEDLGHEVEVVKDGKQAVDLLNISEKFDLVLMDCQMPVMDGYQATKAIRGSNTAYLKSIPIVAMTANTMKGDKEKCLASGMSDYVPKPIDPDELEKVLERWVLRS
jgi:two-component system sensor histidine kinase/response regulator